MLKPITHTDGPDGSRPPANTSPGVVIKRRVTTSDKTQRIISGMLTTVGQSEGVRIKCPRGMTTAVATEPHVPTQNMKEIVVTVECSNLIVINTYATCITKSNWYNYVGETP